MKKFLSIFLAVLMLSALSLSVFAADDVVGYIAFNGANTNDGLTDATPKKSFGDATGTGIMSIVYNGGTMVIVQKANLATDYTFPAMDNPLTITGVYNGTSYVNEERDATTTIGGTLILNGGYFTTFCNNTTMTDMILFYRNSTGMPATLYIDDGATLTITDSVKLIKQTDEDLPVTIMIGAGGKAILSKAVQDTFTIENLGGTLETYNGGETTAPTTTATPAVTTAAPATTTAAPATTTAAPATTTAAPATTTAAPATTTAAPAPATDEAPAPAPADGGLNLGLILGIAAAVVVLGAIVVVVLKKKK